MTDVKIENVIAGSHLGKELELIKLATDLPNAKYSSSGNPSIIVEVDTNKSKKAAGVIFANGKIVTTGVLSLEEGRIAMTILKKMIKNVDSKVNLKKATKIENLVAKTNLGQNLNLKTVSLAIPGSEYDPNRFKGLILRMDKPHASFIMFQSGIIIVTDVLSENKAKKAFNELNKFMIESDIIT